MRGGVTRSPGVLAESEGNFFAIFANLTVRVAWKHRLLSSTSTAARPQSLPGAPCWIQTDGRQKVSFALTSIKGVGRRFANMVCKKAEVDLNKRCERSFLPLHFGLIAGSELPILSSLSQIEICVRLRDGSSEPQGTQDAGIRCQGALARGTRPAGERVRKDCVVPPGKRDPQIKLHVLPWRFEPERGDLPLPSFPHLRTGRRISRTVRQITPMPIFWTLTCAKHARVPRAPLEVQVLTPNPPRLNRVQSCSVV